MIFIMIMSEDGNEIIAFVYDKHIKKMLFTARSILGYDHADDAVQEVFEKLIIKFEKNPEKLRDKPGYFFVISSRNHSLNLLKKETRNEFSFDEEIDGGELFSSTAHSFDDNIVDRERYDTLVALIRRLKPKMRQILEYKYIQEYTNKEIAEELDVSESVVSSRIERAKKKLRELVENEEAQNVNE